jgi:hypothetical protein
VANFMARLVCKKIIGFVLAFIGMDVWVFFSYFGIIFIYALI